MHYDFGMYLVVFYVLGFSPSRIHKAALVSGSGVKAAALINYLTFNSHARHRRWGSKVHVEFEQLS